MRRYLNLLSLLPICLCMSTVCHFIRFCVGFFVHPRKSSCQWGSKETINNKQYADADSLAFVSYMGFGGNVKTAAVERALTEVKGQRLVSGWPLLDSPPSWSGSRAR